MNDFTAELAKLHQLSGAEFSRQVERIALRKEFHPLETDENIFSVGGEKSDDYQNLLIAARKAVEFGYTVYMLPNPTETRTPDFIFVRKRSFRVYDLKTVFGKSSIADSLLESIGQCNLNEKALEVLIFKGRKKISVNRSMATKADFLFTFKRLYEK